MVMVIEEEDIVRENTRKEMNSISVRLGIDNPGSFPNKTKLAEEMIKVIEEEGYQEKLEEKTQRVKDLLRKSRETRLNLSDFKETFKKMRDAKDKYDVPKALSIADELIEKGESILEIKDLIDRIRGRLKELGQEEIKSRYREEMKELIGSLEEGHYRSTEKKLRDLSEGIENTYNKKSKLEESFPKARKRLNKLRRVDLNIDNLKILVNAAVQARKKGEFQEGLEKIDEFLDRSELAFDISKKIERCKSNIRDLKDDDLEIDQYIQVLQNAKEKAESADYKYSLELLKGVNKEMEDDLEKSSEERPQENNRSVTDTKTNPDDNRLSEEDLLKIQNKLDEIEENLKEIKEVLSKVKY